MNELISWMQDNWLDLGRLLAQAAVPVVLVWYGRKLLKTLEVSRQEEQSWQRLSPATAPRTETAAIMEAEPKHTPGVGRRFAQWLQEPMTSSRTSAWQKLARWLQAPAGS